MKKIIAVTILVILISVGVYIFLQTDESKADEQFVSSVPVEDEIIEEISVIEAFGKVVVRETTNITLDFPVKIKEILVKTGESVSKGDRLIKLDISDQKFQLKKMKRNLTVQQKELNKKFENNKLIKKRMKENLSVEMDLYQKDRLDLEKKENELINESSPDFVKLKNDLKVASRILENKKKELIDKRKLLDAGAITQYKFDEFEKTVKNQEDKLTSTKLTLNELIYKKKEEISLLRKALKERLKIIVDIESQLDELELNYTQEVFSQENRIIEIKDEINNLEEKLFQKDYLRGSDIIANLDNAVIYNMNCINGDYKAEGEILFSLMNLDSKIVEADVPEEFIKDVKQGASVKISPLANPETEYYGKVLKIYNMAEKRGGETVIKVEISIDDEKSFLLPNYNVDVEINKVN